MGYSKKNVDKAKRNGRAENGKVIVQYITKEGRSGKDGGDGYSIFLNNTSHTFASGPVYATDGQTDFISVIALKGAELIPTHIGTIQGTLLGALTATVQNNNTTTTTIRIDVNSLLEQSTGTLTIPVTVNTDGVSYMRDSSTGEPTTVDSSTGETIFDSSTYNTATINLNYSWSLAKAAGDVRGYVLDLDNDAACINCDSSGNILPGALRPTCQATLYYGVTPIVGATYSLSIPDQDVTGVAIDTSTGDITFDSSFGFTGTSLELTVQAYDNDAFYWVLDSSSKQKIDLTDDERSLVATAIMTITKAFPGEDGTPARTDYLVLSATSVHVNPNTSPVTVDPTTVSAVSMMQIGEETPITSTGNIVIKYGFNTYSPTTTYVGPVTVDSTKLFLYFGLYRDGVLVDNEKVEILSDGVNGTSVYRLDLTNENASINADSSANILAGAVRPTCTANLFYGAEDVPNVTYGITYPNNQSVQGVSINSSTGVMTFNAGTASTPFSFSGTSLEITVGATANSILRGTAVMTITKSIAGVNGDDAVSYWLSMSANEVKVNPNVTPNTVSPSTISVAGYKQVGGSTPVSASDCVIKYGYNTTSPTTTYSSAITVDGTKDYITFNLCLGSTVVDTETVPILKEGTNGSQGPQGRQGAVVRGPVDYYSQTSTRRFCNGELTDNSHPEDAKYIDVIKKDSSIYYCSTSYTGSANDTWSNVSSNWTVGTNEYDFVATKLLLAQNANIDFLSGNEIYLKDSSNNVCAGAAGGSGVNFWAGSDTPGIAPYRVTNTGALIATDASISGSINATSGTIHDVRVKRLTNPFSELTGDGTSINIETGVETPIYSNIRTDDTVYTNYLNTHTYVSLAWDPSQSGRRLTVAGSMRVTAPAGNYYFYENGTKSKKFENSYEVVELLGWGTETGFSGWIVLSRTNFKTTYHYGKHTPCLCYGAVNLGSLGFYRTFDGRPIYSSSSGTTGLYYLDIPKCWIYDEQRIFPEVSGKGYVSGSSTAPAKATVVNISTTTHTINEESVDYWRLNVAISDDSSMNAGSFYFRIYNMEQWDEGSWLQS